MNTEKIIFEIVAKGKGRSQTGDVSQALREQGFFDSGKSSLEKRDPLLSGGNPVDTLKDFQKQNPR